MTPEDQRITIAEACGWRIERWQADGSECFTAITPKDTYGHESPAQLPDHLNDLNAMHEAEKALDRKLIPEWERHVRQITLRDAEEGTGLYERIIRATAAQRAEAFLKTLGKWTP